MKKGFTLIELLAVIVILAIIALIATPIILGIIADARNEAKVRSAELYLTALEQAIIRKKMSDTTFNPSSCDVNGQIVTCGGETLNVDVDGEKPTSGTIVLENGKVDSYTLVIDGKEIVNGVIQESEYQIGEEVTFNPGDQDRTWNVIEEESDTVTLMLTENLGDILDWYVDAYDTSFGPKDTLEYLNSLTTTWDNVDPIENYTYVNNLNGTNSGYQKVEITNGITKLTHKDGSITTLNEELLAKARILSKEEVFEISQKLNPNLKLENLREYIVSEGVVTNITTVEDAIAYAESSYPGIVYESEYMQTYYATLAIIELVKGITDSNISSFDMSLPTFIYQNLYTETNTSLPYGYWTLSSDSSYSQNAWIVSYGGMKSNLVRHDITAGVRPVITISKTKL